MSKRNERGRFVTFEGGEGTGKSTQVAILADHLRQVGLDVVVTREPGGSPQAERLRDIILSGKAKPFGTFAEAILFSAARIDHLRERIRPALEAGAWVLSDRFADSTRAYQGALGNLDPRLLRTLETVVVGPTPPDLTILLDLPADIGLARAASRGNAPDRFETETLEFHRSLRTAFLDIADSEPRRIVVVDADDTAEIVAERVWQVVAERLGLAVSAS